MEAYNTKIRGMIVELDSKKVYDEPRHIYHESVHTPRNHILAGGNDMTGNILPGHNDMKADIVGPVAKKSSKRKTAPKTASKPVSKRAELIRKVMREQGMTLPQASSFIKNNM
jgi:hypothetical protein